MSTTMTQETFLRQETYYGYKFRSFVVSSENNKVNVCTGFKMDLTTTSWKTNIYYSSKCPITINASVEFRTQILPYSISDIQTASVTNTFTVLKYLPNSTPAQKPTILLMTVQMARRSGHARVINHSRHSHGLEIYIAGCLRNMDKKVELN